MFLARSSHDFPLFDGAFVCAALDISGSHPEVGGHLGAPERGRRLRRGAPKRDG